MSFVEGLVLIVFILAATLTLWLVIMKPYRNNGSIIVEKDDLSGKITYSLELDIDPYEIRNMKNVTFKVVHMKEIAE